MRSIFAKNFEVQSGENKPEEDFQNIPLDIASGNIVMEHFTTLKELDGIHGIMESELEKAVQASDAFKLCEVFEQISPYVTLIRQGGYDHDVPFAPVSIGKRVSLAEKINGVCNDAASKVASTVYVKFDDRKKEYDSLKNSIGEFPRAMSIRADMDSVAESYGALKKSFGSKVSRPGIDLHLERMPKINELRGELLKIATMLETDQSRNNFADLKRGKRDISGIVFSGRIRKDAANLGYDEGVLLCDELKKQIDQYIKECPQVIRTIDYLDNEKAAIEGVVGLLGAVSAPDMDSASVFDTAQKLLFPKDKAPSQKYSFLLSKYDRNQDLRKQAGALYERKSGEICEKANSILNSVKELPEPQTLDEIDKSLDLIQSTMPQIRNCKAVFDVLENFNDSEECENVLGSLQKSYKMRLDYKKQYSDLSYEINQVAKVQKEVDEMFTKPELLEIDLDNILKRMNLPVLLFPDVPVFRELRDAYNALVSGLRGKMNAKAACGLDKLVEFYEQPMMHTGNPVSDEFAVQNRIKKINEVAIPALKKNFAKQMPVMRYEARLETALQGFGAQRQSIQEAQKERRELEGKIQTIKTALEKYDTDALAGCAAWPAAFPETPYTKDLAAKYSMLVQHVKGMKLQEGEGVSFEKTNYCHEALRDDSIISLKSFNIFDYVEKELPVPKNSPVLAQLRANLVCGSVNERLGAVCQTLRQVADSSLSREESSWLSSLKSAFSRDISEGYLSKADKYDYVKPQTISNLRSLFDKYVA